MKNKITKLLTIIALFTIMFTTSMKSVNAVAQTISLGDATLVPGYIAGVRFSTKTTTGGEYLYCLDNSKTTAKNITATLVGQRDAGLAHIILNGYPNKSITGDKQKDYYITQTAVWWYLDETTGSSNLGQSFKSTGSDPNNLRPKIKALVAAGKEAKKAGYAKTTLALTTSDMTLTLKDGYYISEEIYANKYSNISSYSVSLEGAPTGSEIINSAGKVVTSVGVKEKIRVRVPALKVTGTEAKFKIVAKAQGKVYKAYEYQPTNKKMQNVAPSIIVPETTNVKATISLEISTSKVTIIKIDKETNQTLAGATLVLKDSNGNQVTNPWTSTTNGRVIRNLSNGTYTVEELEAPAGYIKSSEKITFTIDADNLSHQITFENYPEVIVPDTASASSIIFTILGIAIIGTGIGFVYRNGKKAK